jgi:hypothetical protein
MAACQTGTTCLRQAMMDRCNPTDQVCYNTIRDLVTSFGLIRQAHLKL